MNTILVSFQITCEINVLVLILRLFEYLSPLALVKLCRIIINPNAIINVLLSANRFTSVTKRSLRMNEK